MARLTVISNQPIVNASGPFEFDNLTLNNAATRCEITLALNTTLTPTMWPDVATKLAATCFWRSPPAAYRPISNIAAEGGPYFEDGLEIPLLTWFFSLPPGSNRRLRFSGGVTGPPLNTILNVFTE